MSADISTINVLALPELIPPPDDSYLKWAVDFWQGMYARRAERASLAFTEYDAAIDDEKSHAEIECLWQFYAMLDAAAKDAGRQLDAAKAALLARQN